MSSVTASKFKPLIILDIDETLIFGADKQERYRFEGSDFNFDMGMIGFHIRLRPGALKLLEFLQNTFQLWVYSNGKPDYVNRIVSYICQQGINIEPKKVLSREGNNYNKQIIK